VRLLRSHGVTTLTRDRHRGNAHEYDVLLHGLNLRLDELRASIGIAHLQHLEEWTAEQGRLVSLYRQRLSGLEELTVPFPSAPGRLSADHLMVVVLAPGVPRDAVRARLRDEGIPTSIHYPPIHRFTAFRRRQTTPHPRTDEVAGRLLTLPLFPGLGENGVDAVCDALATAVSVVYVGDASASNGKRTRPKREETERITLGRRDE